MFLAKICFLHNHYYWFLFIYVVYLVNPVRAPHLMDVASLLQCDILKWQPGAKAQAAASRRTYSEMIQPPLPSTGISAVFCRIFYVRCPIRQKAKRRRGPDQGMAGDVCTQFNLASPTYLLVGRPLTMHAETFPFSIADTHPGSAFVASAAQPQPWLLPLLLSSYRAKFV